MKKIYFLISIAIFTSTANAQLFINEYLAANNSQANVVDTNEFGKREDWFEIYNAGNTSIDLAGYKVADGGNKFYTIPTGFAFTIVPAKGFVRIWADDTTTKAGFTQLHAPFKLSTSGDKLVLTNSIGETLDSISFGTQTANVSEGRCPDGSSTFQFFSTPSPAASNCAQTSVNAIDMKQVNLYPNPAKNSFTVETPLKALVKIFSIDGLLHFSQNIEGYSQINTSDFSTGIYFVQVSIGETTVTKKLMIE